MGCVNVIATSHLLSCRASKYCNTGRRPGLYGGHDSHEGLDLWSLLDGDVLNWLGGEDKRGRRLLLAAQEVRLIIEAAAAALAAARVTGEDPIASTAGSRTTSPTMPPPPAPSKKATPTRDAMDQVLGFSGPSRIAARPAPAAGTADQAVPAV